MKLKIDPRYGDTDADTRMFLNHLQERPPCKILEVGANQEFSCRILADNGFDVTGVDLMAQDGILPHNYKRIETDFVSLAMSGGLERNSFDCAFSTSAIEHFGLGEYGLTTVNLDYDVWAMDCMYLLLRPGGTCYITVPYGREFLIHGRDWRVYDKKTLNQRIIGKFIVEEKIFFKSAGADCKEYGVEDGVPLVYEEEADRYHGEPPHCTVLLRMRKPG